MQRTKTRNAIALGLLLVGAAFVAMGVWRGEPAVVLRKAINVCLECIGLG